MRQLRLCDGEALWELLKTHSNPRASCLGTLGGDLVHRNELLDVGFISNQ